MPLVPQSPGAAQSADAHVARQMYMPALFNGQQVGPHAKPLGRAQRACPHGTHRHDLLGIRSATPEQICDVLLEEVVGRYNGDEWW